MNSFLHINRKLILFFGLSVIFLIFLFIVIKQMSLLEIELRTSDIEFSNADISKPKFAMNNDSKKIFITANEGNFLNNDKILLKDNVRFKSNDFSIETERVIFDRNNQTAQSKTKSFFKTKNTTISSDGFNIYDNGNKIIFYGNSFVILK